MKIKWIVIFCTSIIVLTIFFSYRLTDVPDGLTDDEAAFGYNAVLLSKTLHDENGRFLPVFVLSLDGTDWRQPSTQYLITAFFKLFGPSLFLARFTSVLITIFATILIFILGRLLLGSVGGVIAGTIFITVPQVMIQSHYALDHIIVLPFVIVWLMSVFLYQKRHGIKFLILAAFSLGFGFYSYKGMRATIPVWVVLTSFYIVYLYLRLGMNKKNIKRAISQVAVFLIAAVPFFAVIPLLELKYAGAVFGRHGFFEDSIYDFFYYYIANFDLSFLFIKSDVLLWYGTGKHGMLLLASLPLFLLGMYQTLKSRNHFWIFISLAFLLSPLLYSQVGSVHPHRLTSLIPSYVLISALGLMWLFKYRNLVFSGIGVLLIILMVLNYFDFIKYYWFKYPVESRHTFYSKEVEKPYKELYELAKQKNLTPYISKELVVPSSSKNVTELFFRAIYFPKLPAVWNQDDSLLPPKSVLLTAKGDNVFLPKIASFPQVNRYVYIAD